MTLWPTTRRHCPLRVQIILAVAVSAATAGPMPTAAWAAQSGSRHVAVASGPHAPAPLAPTGVYVPPPSPRVTMDLPATWRFHLGDATGAERPAIDDADWPIVTIPHVWNPRDGQDGGNNYYRGPGWYRARFTVPPALAGRKLFLEFGAANQSAEVWLNGRRLGEHHGGYTAFRVEATGIARTGADNLLAVRVTNAADPDTPPLAADYTFFGGLYRPVRLIATDWLHVRLLDAGGPGAYATPLNVTSAGADWRVTTRLWNSFTTPHTVTVRSTLVDAAGALAGSASTDLALPAASGREVTQQGHLARPRLWQGLADPYLYTVYVELGDGGTIRDVVSQTLGFRSLRVDPAAGFFLNGRPYPLRGVNRHQDRADRGWAIGPAEHAEDLGLAVEMGANALRLAHYPQDPGVYDLADRLGLLLWVEIPLVNRIGSSATFGARTRQQLVEMIRQGHNHPAIALWGIGNEVTLDREGPDPNPLLAELAALAKVEDPTRLTTIAQCCTDEGASDVRHTDAVGYNRYFGWYGGAMDGLGRWADAVHAAHPELAIALSEYGAGASAAHHSPAPGLPDPAGTWHPEEYQALVHEAAWRQIQARPYLWGAFVWNLFDFASDARHEGDRPGINDKGLVSHDRAVRKDAWWWYRVNWSDAPAVYIASRRHEPRAAGPMAVKVYANVDHVRLTVNGVDLGARPVVDHVVVWPNVPITGGANIVTAEGVGAGTVASDRVTWTGLAHHVWLPRLPAPR